jgi:hypothetical protein
MADGNEGQLFLVDVTTFRFWTSCKWRHFSNCTLVAIAKVHVRCGTRGDMVERQVILQKVISELLKPGHERRAAKVEEWY